MTSLHLISFFSLTCMICIYIVQYILGGRLLHRVWDSFVGFPYGISITIYFSCIYVNFPLNFVHLFIYLYSMIHKGFPSL